VTGGLIPWTASILQDSVDDQEAEVLIHIPLSLCMLDIESCFLWRANFLLARLYHPVTIHICLQEQGLWQLFTFVYRNKAFDNYSYLLSGTRPLTTIHICLQEQGLWQLFTFVYRNKAFDKSCMVFYVVSTCTCIFESLFTHSALYVSKWNSESTK